MSRAVPAPTVEQSITIMWGLIAGIHAGDHRPHVLVGGHADHHRLAIGREFGEIGEGMAVQLLRERRRLLGGAIPDAHQQTGAMKIARHVRAHRAQSDEAGLHKLSDSRPEGVKSLA